MTFRRSIPDDAIFSAIAPTFVVVGVRRYTRGVLRDYLVLQIMPNRRFMVMKFLCLAYGDEKGWNLLSEREKKEVLSQDEKIRNRGDFMSAVKLEVTAVKNWGKKLEVEKSSNCNTGLPLAGFSIIEANNAEEAIALVSNTPCARASGQVDIYPCLGSND